MSFCTTVVATNGYPGANVGPIGDIPLGIPSMWVSRVGRYMWWVEYYDGICARPIKADARERNQAIDLACDHAETLRVPVILMEFAAA